MSPRTLPLVTDAEMWTSVLNLLSRLEQDEDFRWIRHVWDEVLAAEEKTKQDRAA